MRVTVHEAARLLNTSDDSIYRWIESGELPAYRINDQFRINRTELLEWATLNDLTITSTLFREADSEAHFPTVSEALDNGGIVPDLPGTERSDVLNGIVERLDLAADERAMLLDLLMARGKAAFVTVQNGVAIPPVRHPIVLGTSALLYAFYLRNDIKFDGEAVSKIFVLLTPTIRTHLQILAELSHMLRRRLFREAVQARSATLSEVARTIEAIGKKMRGESAASR
jgi:PTS system nitrogen regulatory IIA component